MKQAIIDYEKDELGDWIAKLNCGHNQHVRHKPPFLNRPWVLSSDGRTSKLGLLLECKKCNQGLVRDD